MNKKECSDIENLKQRMFRVETIVWILLGVNGIKLGVEAIPLVSAALGLK